MDFYSTFVLIIDSRLLKYLYMAYHNIEKHITSFLLYNFVMRMQKTLFDFIDENDELNIIQKSRN